MLKRTGERIVNVLDRIPLDNKLVATVATFGVTRGFLELGIPWDPTLEAALAGILASGAGIATPNEGSVLRSAEEEDGNADPTRVEAASFLPEDEVVPEESPLH